MKKTILFALALFASLSLFAQDATAPESIGQGTYLGKTIPLRDFPLMTGAPEGKSEYRIVPNNFPVNGYVTENALPLDGDPIRQSALNFATQNRTLEVNFDGPNASEGQATPPDPSGAVGPNHYVSGVNLAIEVFDKDGNTLAGPTSLGNFIGDGQNSGDPIIMYDQLEDRWFVSQFNVGTNGLAIAISETPDPTGAYFLYEFSLDSFPDYPHYSVWHDAYYLTANKGGQNVFALERDVMLAGGADPQILGFTLPGVIANPNTVFSPEPAYLLGTEFDESTPGYITYLQDDGWGAAFDHLKVWELDIDFDTPGNSTVSDPLEIPVAPFDSFLAPFGSGELQQPGTGQRIDMITGVISYAAHYRPFADHNSWLVTFNVDVEGDNSVAGVRWIELRDNDTDDWTVYQEGTYAPDDGNSRFMGSGAIDAQGNIGLAFNVGGPDTPVGIAYTGRFVDDELGMMTIPEETIVEGVGVQTTTNRFGDYSQLSMDPDNFTFWHIAEYFTSNNFWTTRIAAFRISGGFEVDAGISNIISPVDGTLTNAETIEVQIRNFGSEELSNIPVVLSVDGVEVANETFTGTIAPGESVNYTFVQTIDLSTEGQTYDVTACTNVDGDQFEGNNCTTELVKHLFENDLGVIAITAPESGENLSDAEPVTITIENFGSADQSNFEVSFDLDGAVTTEMFTGTITSGETVDYTFSQTVDLSAFQEYNLCASTNLPDDADASNDTTCVTIQNNICQPTSDCAGFDDGVTQIALADQDIITNCGDSPAGYSDDSDIVFNFPLGDNPFEGVLQMGFNDSVFALWIDFNDNGVFETEELVANDFVATANSDFAFTVDFENVPAVTPGEHRMRLRGEDESTAGDVLDPCDDLQFGRTNDYTANITGTLSAEEQAIDNGGLVVSTLDNNRFDIDFTTNYDGRLFIAVFNTLGQQLTYKPVAKRNSGFGMTLDMSAMASGVYIIRLGSENPSTFKTAKIIVK
ncbi:GEVED domain-containing protein [uncultured Dokdonia sp.]|uniref:GEVED domain-containing protein n=1 Tax=uncultured Dokdonia sp. TaxID=575653 RepID=UPI0026348B6C|nr:GEVED domain-containing protein [uncultured Dokdonia sp.]